MKKVGIIMGSDSDLPIIRKATDMLGSLDVPFEVHIYSAHRTPDEARDFARGARANGFGVLIAAAGMAAHLAGAIAANSTLPVIGIPCSSQNLEGMDALLATVQMPTGIPVATVAINGGGNAAMEQRHTHSPQKIAKGGKQKRATWGQRACGNTSGNGVGGIGPAVDKDDRHHQNCEENRHHNAFLFVCTL